MTIIHKLHVANFVFNDFSPYKAERILSEPNRRNAKGFSEDLMNLKSNEKIKDSASLTLSPQLEVTL